MWRRHGSLEDLDTRHPYNTCVLLLLIQAVAQVVASCLGGTSSSNHQLRKRYYESAGALKAQSKSMLFMLGALPVGDCRHRALMFKVGRAERQKAFDHIAGAEKDIPYYTIYTAAECNRSRL